MSVRRSNCQEIQTQLPALPVTTEDGDNDLCCLNVHGGWDFIALECFISPALNAICIFIFFFLRIFKTVNISLRSDIQLWQIHSEVITVLPLLHMHLLTTAEMLLVMHCNYETLWEYLFQTHILPPALTLSTHWNGTPKLACFSPIDAWFPCTFQSEKSNRNSCFLCESAWSPPWAHITTEP